MVGHARGEGGAARECKVVGGCGELAACAWLWARPAVCSRLMSGESQHSAVHTLLGQR